jgi:integrase
LCGAEWVPQVVDDPSLPRRVLAGGQHLPGWSLRDECVVRLLFESGGRISEIVGLSLGDWAAEGATMRARAFDKGSRAERVKVLRFRAGTAKLLRRYVDGDRRRADPTRRTLREYRRLADRRTVDLQQVPLFLTQRGAPLTAKAFRQNAWNPACAAAGIAAHPHQARHWFVTACMREILATTERDGDVQRGKEALIAYMGWRSGEQMLRAYEHHFKGELAATIQDRVHARMDRRVDSALARLERGDVDAEAMLDERFDEQELELLNRLLT